MRKSEPWWASLGHLLPRDVRERVYEPACYERLRDALQSSPQFRASVGLYAINAFLATAGRNLPRIWFDGRCLSGLGRLAVGLGLTGVGAWLIVIVRYAYAY